MEEIYIRYRGRVQGPYTSEQVMVLSQRGEFTRMHEVSSDQVTWSRATNFPELFAVERAERRSEASFFPDEMDVEVPLSAAQSTLWHYSTSAGASPPIELHQLQLLFQTGRLDLSTHVWTEGMPAWLPAEQLSVFSDGLRSRTSNPGAASGNNSTGLIVFVIIAGIVLLIGIVAVCGCAGLLTSRPT